MTDQTVWQKTGEEQRALAKFLARDIHVTVNLEAAPHPTTVEGKYGKRKMYIIDTKEYGATYVTPLQLIRICELAGDLKKGFVAVTL